MEVSLSEGGPYRNRNVGLRLGFSRKGLRMSLCIYLKGDSKIKAFYFILFFYISGVIY